MMNQDAAKVCKHNLQACIWSVLEDLFYFKLPYFKLFLDHIMKYKVIHLIFAIYTINIVCVVEVCKQVWLTFKKYAYE